MAVRPGALGSDDFGQQETGLQLDARKVTVDTQVTELRGKGGVLSTTKNERNRTIIVPTLVALELRRHLREGHGGTWVDGTEHRMLFTDGDKLVVHKRFYEQAWWPALAKAGMPRRFKFHALRHHCASTLLAQGASLPAVAGYIGDHQQTVLRTYSHWLRSDEDVPTAILDRVLAAPVAAVSPSCHDEIAEGQ